MSYMRAPRSYTCEDVVEMNVHGGPVPLRETLSLCLDQGARQAGGGEFTLRAFLNGRLDLSQAEAVLDVIQSRTSQALRVAEAQLAGGLSREIYALRRRLLELLAHVQATIDFPEDVSSPDLTAETGTIRARLEWLVREAERGALYRQGLHTAIVGRPNVGKSSLLNALLRKDRAIVTAVPGTTRDTLEESVSLGGIPLVLVDTAGLSQSPDPVERLGVERSKQALAQADLVLMVCDGSEAPRPEDCAVARMLGSARVVLVLNKSDLGSAPGYEAILPAVPRVTISALTGAGLDALESVLVDAALGGASDGADPVASNPRHRDLLLRARNHLDDLEAALSRGVPLDLISIDLSEAVAALGQITGEEASEQLLETIFGRFCIGK